MKDLEGDVVLGESVEINFDLVNNENDEEKKGQQIQDEDIELTDSNQHILDFKNKDED
jgi:hypothetical protein